MPKRPLDLFALDAEYAVIGTLLLGVEGDWQRVSRILGPEDFYRERHALIFAAAASVADKNVVPDAITIVEEMTANGTLKDAGERTAIFGLLDSPLSGQNIEAWARIIKDKAERRRAVEKARQLEEQARDPRFQPPKREDDDDYLTYAR